MIRDGFPSCFIVLNPFYYILRTIQSNILNDIQLKEFVEFAAIGIVRYYFIDGFVVLITFYKIMVNGNFG